MPDSMSGRIALVAHTPEKLEFLFQVNFFGTVYMIKTLLPGMMARNSGRLADPEKIVDAIDKGVAKGRDTIYPGEARLLYLWKALFPKLWWKVVLSFEK